MVLNRGISLFVATLFLIGLFFVTSPEISNAQEIEPGCCQYGLEEGELSCVDSVGLCPKVLPGTSFDGFFPGESCDEASNLCSSFVINEVPTLSEWGLIATAGILGIAGFMVIRRKRITA